MNNVSHHGIEGMHWGIRRYQNKDGTLTEAGRRRLAKKDSKWSMRNYDKIYKKALIAAILSGLMVLLLITSAIFITI